MADFWSSIALGGWGSSCRRPSHRRAHQTSADGGRFTMIDEIVDGDGHQGYNHQPDSQVGMAGIAESVGNPPFTGKKYQKE